MVVFALILLVLVALVVVGVLAGSTTDVDLKVFDTSFTTTTAGVFLAGVAAGLIALFALVLLYVASRRRAARRAKNREMRRQVAETDKVTAERDRLIAEKEKLENRAEDRRNDRSDEDGSTRALPTRETAVSRDGRREDQRVAPEAGSRSIADRLTGRHNDADETTVAQDPDSRR